MYFIELLVKKFKKKEVTDSYNPLEQKEENDYEYCGHIFMPIDSSGETLACTKCGLVVKRKDLKKKNIFRKN